MPAAPDLRGSDYDDKFRILLSPASFLPALRRCRIESWLRDISVAVAFTDIDDFKALNTRYTESRSEEHTSELQSPCNLVCRLLLEKKKQWSTDGEVTEDLQLARPA